MAAKEINVNYNANGNPPFSFSPNSGNVEMDAAGTITFKSDPNFTYTDFTTTPESSQFSWSVDQSGDLVVTDSDAASGTYEYCITIDVDGNSVSSDPQIINKV